MADRKITALAELTAPVATDVFPVIDVSEAENANKNKKIQLTTILKNIPNGTVSAPSVGFVDDSGLTGFFRVASNEIGISANQTLIGSFTTTGFQLGSGTPAAQLHLFSTDTTDQVIIENTDTGADNAPDLVLFRNSASPAANDNLANLIYRANDSAGNAHDYASIVASIETTTDGSEDGVLDIMSSASGTLASRIRLLNNKVGIGEATPLYPLHLTSTAAGIAFQIESSADDAASGADLMLVHRRGASGAGRDNDVLSTIFYRGKNDNGTPEEVDYAAIQSVIIDASDGTEDGKLNLQVMAAGTLTTKLAVDATGIDITGTVTDDGAVHDGNVDLNGNIDVSGTTTLNDDVTFTGASANIVFDKSDNALEFADNAKATFGSSADLEVFHDGSNSRIKDVGTGGLILTASELSVKSPIGEDVFKGISDGAVQLFHNGVKKVETSADGLDLPDNSKLQLGTGQDLQLYHDSNNSVIDSNTGNLYLQSANSLFIQGANNENVIKYVANGALELYHDGTKKAETSSSGITVTGTVTATSFVGDGAVTINNNGTSKLITGSGTANTLNANTNLTFDGTTLDVKSGTGVINTGQGTFNGDVTFTGNSANVVFDKSDDALEFADNAKATFGADSDLQIFHDGSQSVIKDNGTGQLLISGENTVAITNAAATENYARFIKDGAAELYHNNVKKIQTSATGVDIPEDFIAGSGSKLTVGASADLTFFHDSTNSYVQNNTGDLILGDTNHQYFRGNTSDKSVSLYFNGSEKAKTTSSGVTVTGTVTASTGAVIGGSTFSSDGTLTTTAAIIVENSQPGISFNDTGANPDFIIQNRDGLFAIRDTTNNANRFLVNMTNGELTTTGSIIPDADNTDALGSSSKRFTTLHSAALNTGDINMSNLNDSGNEVDGSKGSWTLQEGADDLFIINRVSGKKYKFNLTEIS